MPIDDLIDVGTDLVLDGRLSVLPGPNFGMGRYPLFTYGGDLENKVLRFGVMPPGFGYGIDIGRPGIVDLVVTPDPGALLGCPSFRWRSSIAGAGIDDEASNNKAPHMGRGLRDDVVEMDYMLGWVLWGIGSHAELSASWAFKGGTCLKKCHIGTSRFSEDLDFTVLPGGPVREGDLAPIFSEVLRRTGDESGINFAGRPPAFKTHESGRYAPSPAGRPGKAGSARGWPHAPGDRVGEASVPKSGTNRIFPGNNRVGGSHLASQSAQSDRENHRSRHEWNATSRRTQDWSPPYTNAAGPAGSPARARQ